MFCRCYAIMIIIMIIAGGGELRTGPEAKIGTSVDQTVRSGAGWSGGLSKGGLPPPFSALTRLAYDTHPMSTVFFPCPKCYMVCSTVHMTQRVHITQPVSTTFTPVLACQGQRGVLLNVVLWSRCYRFFF